MNEVYRSFPELTERRGQRRLGVNCLGLMRLSPNLTFRCRLHNLTLNAAQVECESRYALMLRQAGEAGTGTLEISIALPAAGTTRSFTANCEVLYRQRLTEQRMLLGLRFLGLEWAALQTLDQFLGAAVAAA